MRIACVHQGYELYGSDRCFAESVSSIRKAYPDADIEAVLPRDGALATILEGVASRIVFEDLWVLRRRHFGHLVTVGLLRLPVAILRAARRFARCDLVYINTCVIADYSIAARFFPSKSLLHVHELPSRFTRLVLRGLVRWSGCEIVFNSYAASAAFAMPASAKTHIIYNGISGPVLPEITTYDGGRALRVLMLGRVSPAKGQDVLLSAIAALPPAIRERIELRMVGSAFENAERERALPLLADQLGLGAIVSIEPFANETAPLYRWADIVVMPSRQEALGRVAIEAMAYGRPVVASRVGGLQEVVADGETGWLVAPGLPGPLARVLHHIVESPGELRDFAAAGRQRYLTLFSDHAVSAAISSVLAGKLRKSVDHRPVMVAAGDNTA